MQTTTTSKPTITTTNKQQQGNTTMPQPRARSSPTRAVAIGLIVSLAAAGLISKRAQAAGLLVAEGGFGGVLEIKEHNVNVTINNGVAVTEVEQIFLNTENRIVEALYTFPVPKGASVSNFSMWIGGKEMIGEVVEKKRAREIYESYKQTRRDPGLLEQVDYKTFEMRIFPIPAGAEQRIQVTYYQELDFDHDWGTYVYPLATVTRTDINQRTTGKFSLTLDVKNEVPIVDMKSPSHADDFVITPHADAYYRASLETDAGDLSRDVVLAFETSRPQTGIDVITSKQRGEDGYFMLTLTAGEELAELNRGMDYVFVLDVSGSMANDGKLRLSRNSIAAFVESLGEQDRFEVMAFNAATNTLFNQMQPVTADNKRQASEFISSQRARGGTELRPALSVAYRYKDSDRTLNVVILSDGMTEQKEQRQLLQLIGERPSGSRVFCVGVGNEVNRPLLKQLADDAGGLAAFISEQDSFQRQAQAFRRKLMRPAIRDLKIDIGGATTYDIEPQELPDLFHGAPLRLYGRYKKQGEVDINVAGEVQGLPIDQTVSIRLPKADDENPEIERMWAWHRVERLMAEERETGSRGSQQSEIVRLCEGYSIVSQYASFIVLENDAEYRRWKIDRRNATRIERDRRSQARVRRRLEQLRADAVTKLGPQKPDEDDASKLTEAVPASTPSPQTAQRQVQPSNPTVAPRPAASPDPADSPRPAASPGPVVRDTPRKQRRRKSRDIRMPSFGGGGAIDPVTGLVAVGLAGAAAASRRRKRKRLEEEEMQV